MVLSDRTIKEELAKKRIVIDPLDPVDIQPASVDVHLDRQLLVFRNSRRPFIDVRQDVEDLTELQTIEEDRPFILHPGEFVLASTLEQIVLPDDIVARLEGKSSLGRIGLLIHSTAGYVDPGWKGHLTLELSNVAN
ncbi:MAG: dCTP deaminase, partial [Dehalococcoidia bacterium]